MREIIVMAGLLWAGVAGAQTVEDMGWLAGAWVEAKGDGLTEEHWMAPAGGLMLMMNRNGRAGRVPMFEYARILMQAGRPAFVAQPNGAPPTVFRLIALKGEDATFESIANDFPTRVRYWREGAALKAEISGHDGKVAQSWTFQRRQAVSRPFVRPRSRRMR